VVVGIAFVDALHGFGVSVGALSVVEFIGVRVKDGERQDVVAFAGGRRLEGASFGEEVGALGEVGFAGAIPEFVVKGHCLSPVSHCAARIFFGDFLELRVGYFVLEGMQKGDAALELGLDCGSAGGREGDGAEFFIGVVMVLRLLSGEQIWYERQSADESEKSEFWGLHDDSNVRHEKRSHGKRGCQCAALIGDGRAAEFLLLEQFSNGVNTYTRGNGSGTSRKNDTVVSLGFKDRPKSGSPGQMKL
jgi:hypothetical protein